MASAAADSPAIEPNATSSPAAKRPVWNVPSNGAIEVGPVMGAVSWPALSESTKASPKSSSTESLKSLSEGSIAATPGLVVSSPNVKPTINVPNPNQNQNPVSPARQKPMKRNSSIGNSSNSSNSIPTKGEIGSQSVIDKQATPEPSPRFSKNGGGAQQPHAGGDQGRGYGVNRRWNNNNNGGPHNNHRRDQSWDRNRNAHSQHQQQQPQPRGGFRSYPRPPAPVSGPFVSPAGQFRPFVGNAMGFPDVHPMYFVPQLPPESPRGMPFVPQLPPAMFFPAMDPQRALLLRQIDYYFSSENLCKDVYLRQNMDDQGWVPLSLIAGFNRVRLLTNNFQYILDTVRFSTVVEIQGDKIRRRDDWVNWLLSSNHSGATSSTQSPTTLDCEVAAMHLQNVGLEGASSNYNNMRGQIQGEVLLTRSASGNLSNQFQVVGDPSKNGSGQFTGFPDSDKSKSTRNLIRSDTL